VTEARQFKFQSSLARKLEVPGGRSVGEADRLAREGLETHRLAVMQTVDATLVQLVGLCAEMPADAGKSVYTLASRVIDLVAYFDTGPLHEAAYSLCELSDRMLAADSWQWPSVLVHVQAMKLILTDGCRRSRMSDMLLDCLKELSGKHWEVPDKVGVSQGQR